MRRLRLAELEERDGDAGAGEAIRRLMKFADMRERRTRRVFRRDLEASWTGDGEHAIIGCECKQRGWRHLGLDALRWDEARRENIHGAAGVENRGARIVERDVAMEDDVQLRESA